MKRMLFWIVAMVASVSVVGCDTLLGADDDNDAAVFEIVEVPEEQYFVSGGPLVVSPLIKNSGEADGSSEVVLSVTESILDSIEVNLDPGETRRVRLEADDFDGGADLFRITTADATATGSITARDELFTVTDASAPEKRLTVTADAIENPRGTGATVAKTFGQLDADYGNPADVSRGDYTLSMDFLVESEDAGDRIDAFNLIFVDEGPGHFFMFRIEEEDFEIGTWQRLELAVVPGSAVIDGGQSHPGGDVVMFTVEAHWIDETEREDLMYSMGAIEIANDETLLDVAPVAADAEDIWFDHADQHETAKIELQSEGTDDETSDVPVENSRYVVSTYGQFESALEDPEDFAGEMGQVTIEVQSSIGEEDFAEYGRLRADTGTADLKIFGSPGEDIELDAGGHSGILRIDSEASVTIENLTFLNAFLDDDQGAALSVNGELHIRESHFENNVSTVWYVDGGAVSGNDDVEIRDSVFVGNVAIGDDSAIGGGGAVGVATSGEVIIVVKRSEFRDNVAREAGGAVSSSYDVEVFDSTFEGNSTETGHAAAIHGYGGTVSVGSSVFIDNVDGDGESSEPTIGGGHESTLIDLGGNTFDPEDQEPDWHEQPEE